MKKNRIILVAVLLCIACAGIGFLLYEKHEQKGLENKIAFNSEKKNPVVINVAGQNTGLWNEIHRLKSFYEKTPANSMLRFRLYIAMGETYVKYGQIDSAIVCFTEVLNKKNNDKKSNYYLGRLYLAKGDTMKAARYWKRYLELDPESYKKSEIEKIIKRYETF